MYKYIYTIIYTLISKETFSPVMAKGVLNHCSNVATDLKMVGRRKLSRAHSSGRLFCVVKRSERKVQKLIHEDLETL